MNDHDTTGRSTAGSDPATTAAQAHRPSAWRSLPKKKGTWIVAAGMTCAVAGLGVFSASTSSAASASGTSASGTSAAATSTPTATPTAPGSGGGARSGPTAGGSTGIVDTTSASGFTFATATGVKVTVDETAGTAYLRGTHPTSASAVHKGSSVLVLGTVDTATITATRVVVQPGGDGGAAAAKKSGVIPFQQGTPSPTKSDGKVPSDYTEGEGTVVSGTAADKATTAAQSVFAGGIVDRVVKLADGEYEVHNISINWPHHVFVSKSFKVLGAE
ncbi:hypothetical protein OG896_09905 [Streptomyces sp. NBC_00669]|uniref:hypothetical protein n=1 Tax=Streptomyces sp. NBC_00669 TaxID=2976011 RepID=UPI002E2F6FAE|nr:hypothetical protein [Streptomyces sp. NBC_00669]